MTNGPAAPGRHVPVRAPGTIGGLVLCVLLAGCGDGSSAATVESPSSSPSSTSSASSSPSRSSTASPSTSPSPRATTTSSSSRCTADHLDVDAEVPAGAGAAGSTAILLSFTDTGDRPCVLGGFPGVSFVAGGDGTRVGTPAVRTGRERTVTVLPGDDTTAVLQISAAGDYPSSTCDPTAADGFRVYPPGSTSAAFVRYPVRACAGDTGSSPQLRVQSVGTTVP